MFLRWRSWCDLDDVAWKPSWHACTGTYMVQSKRFLRSSEIFDYDPSPSPQTVLHFTLLTSRPQTSLCNWSCLLFASSSEQRDLQLKFWAWWVRSSASFGWEKEVGNDINFLNQLMYLLYNLRYQSAGIFCFYSCIYFYSIWPLEKLCTMRKHHCQHSCLGGHVAGVIFFKSTRPILGGSVEGRERLEKQK